MSVRSAWTTSGARAVHWRTILILHCLFPLSASAAPIVEWTRQIGTPHSDTHYDVAVDRFGALVAVGATYGSLGGVNPDSSGGTSDAYVVKYDLQGNLMWARQLGPLANDSAESVSTDRAGNVYVVGGSQVGIGRPPGYGAFSYLAKYDSQGNHTWSKETVVVEGKYSYISGIRASEDDFLFLSGSTPRGDSKPDAFIQKCDLDGNVIWTRKVSIPGHITSAGKVSFDSLGAIYVSGYARQESVPNDGDAYLAKFDAAGNQMWYREFGTSQLDSGGGLDIDALDNIYVSGTTNGSLGGKNFGGADLFVSKFDRDGNSVWSRQIGTIDDDSGDFSSAYGGGIYFTIDDQRPSSILANALGRIGADGSLLWTREFGDNAGERYATIATGVLGNLYLVGSTSETLSSDLRDGSDILVVKFHEIPEPTTWSLLVVAAVAISKRSSLARRASVTPPPELCCRLTANGA